MTNTAVVLLNFNGRGYLEQFLPSVVHHSKGAEIIIVDNGSTDNSVEFLQSNYPDLEIINLPSNKGFAGGYNEAIQQINAEICVLLNTDVEVTEGWLNPILSLMESNSGIAACQPKILSYNEKDKFEYAGAAGGYIDYLGFPFCRGRIFQTLEKDEAQYDDVHPIFWASGACLFIRKDVFLHLGGFDEDFFAHMEEIDLCWRMQNAGYKVYYNGISTVYHIGGGTLSRSNPRKTYLNFRNGLSMFAKNEKPQRLWWKLPARTLLDMIAAIKFAVADSLDDCIAVLKAHMYFWTHIRTNLEKRKEAKKQWIQKNPDLQIYRGFIVLDYFLVGKKKFSQISIAVKKRKV